MELSRARPAFWAKRTPISDLSPESGRRQCSCIARSTGLRCRQAAMRGSKRCFKHGGRQDVLRALRKACRVGGAKNPSQCARAALYALARPAGFPTHYAGLDLEKELHATTLRRAWLAYLNRELDPKSWRSFVRALPGLPRRPKA